MKKIEKQTMTTLMSAAGLTRSEPGERSRHLVGSGR